MKNKKIMVIMALSCMALSACAGKSNKNTSSSSSATEECDHQLVHYEAKDATYQEDGNIEYWQCSVCGKYFDADGNELKKRNITKKIGIRNYEKSTSAVTCFGKAVSVSYTEADKTEFEGYMATLLQDVKDEVKEYSQMEEIEEAWLNKYYYLEDQYKYSRILADAYSKDEMYDTQDEIYELLNNAYTFQSEYETSIASSKYRNDYYADMSEDEINAYVASLDPDADKQQADISTAMEGYLNDYYSGDLTAYEALSSYIQKAQELAELKSYTDYLEYAYDNVYGREYEVADTVSLKDNIKNVIVPMENSALSDFQQFYRNEASTSEQYEVQGLAQSFFGGYLDEMEDYAKFIGGEYLKSYYNIFNTGNYFLCKEENDNVTGYTWAFADGTPFIFLSGSYQDLGTFIHEFGHYNAYLTGCSDVGYDLDEVHSQGNEMLFYTYLLKNNVYSEKVAQCYLNYKVYYMTDAVITGYMINELEKYLYTNTTFSEDDLKNKWCEIVDDLGIDSAYKEDNTITNWVYPVLLNYQGYYISYATSAIAALEIYATAINDMSKARDAYISIYTQEDGEDTFTKALENAGLYSVFSDECYNLLKTTFNA